MVPPTFNSEEIVSLLGEMYTLILRFQSLPEESNISYGPHTLPSFDTDAWIKAGMDPETVNVLSKLPLFNSDKEKTGPDMSPMLYLRDAQTVVSDDEKTSDNEDEENERRMHLESWTDPFFLKPEEKYIESWCIPLTSANHGGYVLILDCKTNEIFEVDYFSARYDFPEAPPDTHEGYYRHFPSGPAPNVLKKWVAYYRDLVIVPDYRHGNWWFGDEGEMGGEEEGKEVRQMLLNYGWPDNFHEEEFKAALVPWKEMKDEAEGADMEAEDARIKEAAKDWVRRTYGE
ncbi:hypothetical protein BcDW1_72 [Botrytis cinerea BcDW1]|uniref:Uncharacterized protein n=1 Tax=Botryotinia fuckeliana (strain BcDW1) TaxID=1290391 RepID=M7UC66_BOTF1|nr:hypothetical protein BcDW1_72 [Botrytis cinerea BcDW1]